MKQYVICVCFAMILCSAVDILMPSKKYKNIIKIVCAIFVISVIVSPIDSLLSFDYKLIELDKYFEDDSGFLRAVEDSKEKFEGVLKEDGADVVAQEISKQSGEALDMDVKIVFERGKFVLVDYDKDRLDSITDYLKHNYALEIEVDDGT